jgi:hypothetical protein
MSVHTRMYTERVAPISRGSIVHPVTEQRSITLNKATLSC